MFQKCTCLFALEYNAALPCKQFPSCLETLLRRTILISPLASPLCIMLNWKTLVSGEHHKVCKPFSRANLFGFFASTEYILSTVFVQGFGCFTQDFETARFELAVKINHCTTKGKKKKKKHFEFQHKNKQLIKKNCNHDNKTHSSSFCPCKGPNSN